MRKTPRPPGISTRDGSVGSDTLAESKPAPESVTSTTAPPPAGTSTVTRTTRRGASLLPWSAALDSASATATARLSCCSWLSPASRTAASTRSIMGATAARVLGMRIRVIRVGRRRPVAAAKVARRGGRGIGADCSPGRAQLRREVSGSSSCISSVTLAT